MKTSIFKQKPIIFLLLIFIVPMIISWILFYYADKLPFKHTHHGHLIIPPYHLEVDRNVNPSRKWIIFYVPGEHCDSICEKTWHNLQQIRLALGKNALRIEVKKAHASFLFNQNHTHENFVSSSFQVKNKIFLIDPAHFVFMYYLENANPMDILKDMKRVLEVSQIG